MWDDVLTPGSMGMCARFQKTKSCRWFGNDLVLPPQPRRPPVVASVRVAYG